MQKVFRYRDKRSNNIDKQRVKLTNKNPNKNDVFPLYIEIDICTYTRIFFFFQLVWWLEFTFMTDKWCICGSNFDPIYYSALSLPTEICTHKHTLEYSNV